MRIDYLKIENYKSIEFIEICDWDNACILVGKNNTGKTVILDAIMTAFGQKEVLQKQFNKAGKNIEISVKLRITSEDLQYFKRQGVVSRYKKEELFLNDFEAKFPSYKDGILSYTFIANYNGTVRYFDGFKKNNLWIPKILPRIYYIDHIRNAREIESAILQTGIREKTVAILKENRCMFDETKNCNACFDCIGKIEQKKVDKLTIFETEKLLEYKMLHADTSAFMDRLNDCFRKNSGLNDNLVEHINVDLDEMMKMEIVRYKGEDETCSENLSDMSEGMKSIYILSLLEAYMYEEEKLPCIILMEDPELFLHPQLQRNASQILYRLSEKNQIIFSTHSPEMIFNFNSRQIKQVRIAQDGNPTINEHNDISRVLDDLGYSAGDLMNVSFVFIVEGKQDKARLPLLLKKYYSEVRDDEGNLKRIAIISTNSCTNIKTYANLKYINQIYLKDRFLMIRDGDGKDSVQLKQYLCDYYEERGKQDKGSLPNVRPENVLILKYYSFENYFLNPKVMAEIGVVESEMAFYEILFEKYREYLYKNKSFVKIEEILGRRFESPEDIKNNMETVLIYGRGHNLFDIFYGRYKGSEEEEILKKYIDAADRDDFKDILDAVETFAFFDNRKK